MSYSLPLTQNPTPASLAINIITKATYISWRHPAAYCAAYIVHDKIHTVPANPIAALLIVHIIIGTHVSHRDILSHTSFMIHPHNPGEPDSCNRHVSIIIENTHLMETYICQAMCMGVRRCRLVCARCVPCVLCPCVNARFVCSPTCPILS